MVRSAVGGHTIITDYLVELVRESIMENRRFTITEIISHFLLLAAKNCHGARVVQKIVRQEGAKATDTGTQGKAYGVSIGISVAVP